MDLILIGSAASGKSTLAANFSKYLIERGYTCKIINLDPAATYLPYSPDFDIRKYFNYLKYMQENKLGPNGAIIKIYEELLKRRNVLNAIRKISFDNDFCIIDTSGQLEIVLFHEFLKIFSKILRQPVVIFLLDGEKYSKKEFLLSKLFNIIIYLKYDIKSFSIISKSDMIKMKTEEEEGMIEELYKKLEDIFVEFKIPVRDIYVSNIKKEGYDDLLNMLYEISCVCGDYA